MTRDDIIRMAREAGTLFVTQFGVASATTEWLEQFAALVTDRAVAAEREACLGLALAEIGEGDENLPYRVAAAIRARGEMK